MANIWTDNGIYRATPYKNEAELEASIIKVQRELFGPNRFYIDVKKKIEPAAGQQLI